jgi:hypothetical protein
MIDRFAVALNEVKMATTALEIPLQQANDLLTGAEWSPAHSRELLALTADIKANPSHYAETLRGKFLALIFEKPSLRTRVQSASKHGRPRGIPRPHAGAPR